MKNEKPLPPPDNMKYGETLDQFLDRVYASFPDSKKFAAVAHLSSCIPDDIKQEYRRRKANGEQLVPHFIYGMTVRSVLRHGGFGEEYWPIWNLDDIYQRLFEAALER